MPNVIIGLADLYCEDSLVDCDFLHRSRGHCNSFQEFRLVLKFFLFSEAVVKVFHIGFLRKTIRKYKLKFVKKKASFSFLFSSQKIPLQVYTVCSDLWNVRHKFTTVLYQHSSSFYIYPGNIPISSDRFSPTSVSSILKH